MPKKIPNVKEKILKSAEKLFNHHSYEDVDMRLIAREAGVSVGTIYYHFSDKSGIFISAYEQKLDKFFAAMDRIKSSALHPNQKLSQYLCYLYQVSSSRKESVKLFFYEGMLNLQLDSRYPHINTTVEKIKTKLLGDFKIILKDMTPKDSQMEDKMAERIIISALGSFFTLNQRFPQEIEENVKYITKTMEALANNRGISLD